ncbi:SpoIIE family protein phosphatase [Nocardioides solisilvae]|uniref:SpoIIE family protein phosphatase n=1 Tax=Nocardioides solisilvae TaxID=1542435 RepID=UPI0013A58EED|nr:SpoIIE family protein phosphatase [Nocardioides solisilvae]
MIHETTPAQSSPTAGLPPRPADEVGPARLEQLVELAARLLGGSDARMTLLPDLRTVMAGLGRTAQRELVKWPAEDALCAVTLRGDGPLVVPDARRDDRVNDLPSVAAGRVGAYLGVPLRAGGHTIGALCVTTDRAREWRDEDVALLDLVGQTLSAELRVAALSSSHHDDRLLWQLAVDAAGVGAWDWDLVTGDLRWDERLHALSGIEPDSFGGTIEAFGEWVHPEDRERVSGLLDEAIASCGTFAAEYRIVHADGTVRWVSARGSALVGEDGTAARLVGAAYDSTLTQDADARVARILESMPAAFFHLDTDWRFTFVNARAERMLGAVTSRLTGGNIWELFPDAVGSDFETHYRASAESGEPTEFEAHYPPPLASWYEVRVWPSPDGLSVYFLDITERKLAQQKLARSATRARLLAEVTSVLTDTLDSEQGVAELARLLVPEKADWCIVTVTDGPDPQAGQDWRRNMRDLGWWHRDAELRPTLEAYARRRVRALREDSFQARALMSRSTLLADDARETVTAGLEPGEAADLYRALDVEQALFVPMIRRGRVIGMLTLGRGADRETFGPEAVEMLEDVAGRAALALDNARAYSAQRDMAEGLQRSLLTAPPRSDLVEIAVRYAPAAEAAQVGGDWYDAFVRPERDLVLVIGDVVGHDVEAAGAMGQVRGLLRGIAVTCEGGPGEVLRRVDRAMDALAVESTATALVASVGSAAADGSVPVHWSNAGHPPALVLLPDDGGGYAVDVLGSEAPDLLLGFDADFERTDHALDLPPGAVVLLYTDGLVERRGQDLDDGIDELRAVVAELLPAAADLDGLLDGLLARLLPDHAEDDVALVAVRVR